MNYENVIVSLQSPDGWKALHHEGKKMFESELGDHDFIKSFEWLRWNLVVNLYSYNMTDAIPNQGVYNPFTALDILTGEVSFEYELTEQLLSVLAFTRVPPDPNEERAAPTPSSDDEVPPKIDLAHPASWTPMQTLAIVCPRVSPRRYVSQLQGMWAYRLRMEFGLGV